MFSDCLEQRWGLPVGQLQTGPSEVLLHTSGDGQVSALQTATALLDVAEACSMDSVVLLYLMR